jgi:hypothetical protein
MGISLETPKNWAEFSLDRMHRPLHLAIAMQVLLWAGCAAPIPQPPKIEGAVNSVSQKDMQRAIAFCEQEMQRQFGRVVPIDRVQVTGRNEIVLIYHRDGSNYWYPVQRIHGVWTPPPPVWVTG